MGCGPTTYYIEIEGNNYPPNLLHLEEELKKEGFTCSIPLKNLQNGIANISYIEQSDYCSSYISKYNDNHFKMMVFFQNVKLRHFADNYEPLPFS